MSPLLSLSFPDPTNPPRAVAKRTRKTRPISRTESLGCQSSFEVFRKGIFDRSIHLFPLLSSLSHERCSLASPMNTTGACYSQTTLGSRPRK